jgi:hypothetical protein
MVCHAGWKLSLSRKEALERGLTHGQVLFVGRVGGRRVSVTVQVYDLAFPYMRPAKRRTIRATEGGGC